MLTPDISVLLDIQQRLEAVPNFLPETNPLGVFLQEDAEVYLVDNVGVLVAVDIRAGDQAHVHMTFWDRRLRGRETLVETVARLVIQRHDLEYVWTAVPKKLRHVVAFVKRVGFEVFHEDERTLGLKLERR